MAKRRNPKKEKALRNQAYARKFRKKTNNGRYNNRRSSNQGQAKSEETEEGVSATDSND